MAPFWPPADPEFVPSATLPGSKQHNIRTLFKAVSSPSPCRASTFCSNPQTYRFKGQKVSPRQSPQGPPPFTGTEIESGFSSRFDSANSLIRASILWIAASVASSTIPFIDSSNVDLSSFKFLTSDISIPIAVDAAATATIMPTKRVPTFTHLDMLFCSLESGFPIWKPPSPLSVTRNRSTCNSPSNDSHLRADPDD